jgi:hypothetical protein
MDLYTEENEAVILVDLKRALAGAVVAAEAVPQNMLLYYKELSGLSSGPLRPVLWYGMVFLTAVYRGLIIKPCEGGCAKTAKKALGYKFCPHCGAKL